MEKILAVYLKRVIDQLEKAIDEVDDGMPEGVERLDMCHYEGKSPFPIMDEKNWVKKPTGKPVILLPVSNLLKELKDDLCVLVPEHPHKIK